jgi:hypothetical protein
VIQWINSGRLYIGIARKVVRRIKRFGYRPAVWQFLDQSFVLVG